MSSSRFWDPTIIEGIVLIFAFLTTFIASVLLPSFDKISGVGPIKIIPLALHASANSGLSDKNPYPGWIASTSASLAILIIESISKYACIGPLLFFNK